MALATVNRRSKDMISDPIADAHEQRAQSEQQNTDANDEQLGSHGFSNSLDLGSLLSAQCSQRAESVLSQ
jgi:hypothetical protein